jgi:hypothetical protein
MDRFPSSLQRPRLLHLADKLEISLSQLGGTNAATGCSKADLGGCTPSLAHTKL